MRSERRTGVLVNDALLSFVEALAGLVGPPLLKLTLLIIQATGRVERVLEVKFSTIAL